MYVCIHIYIYITQGSNQEGRPNSRAMRDYNSRSVVLLI